MKYFHARFKKISSKHFFQLWNINLESQAKQNLNQGWNQMRRIFFFQQYLSMRFFQKLGMLFYYFEKNNLSVFFLWNAEVMWKSIHLARCALPTLLDYAILLKEFFQNLIRIFICFTFNFCCQSCDEKFLITLNINLKMCLFYF